MEALSPDLWSVPPPPLHPRPIPPPPRSSSLADLSRLLGFGGGLILFLLLSPRLSAAEDPDLLIPETPLGTKAPTSIITPVDLTVIDPEKTESKRRLEKRRTPLLYEGNTNGVRHAQEELQRAFAAMRDKFQNRLESNFQRRILLPRQLRLPKFDRFTANFQRANKNFPLATNLAAAWASGQSGQQLLDEWTRALAEHAPPWIRPYPLPDDFKSSSPTTKILVPAPGVPASRLQPVLQNSQTVAATNVLALGKARRVLEKALPQDSPARNRYLASFLQPNLLPLDKLTRQWQARRTADLWAADSYRAGDVLVAADEIITPKVRRALDQLRAALEKEKLKSDLHREQSKSQSALAWVREQTEASHQERTALRAQTYWMIAGTVLVLMALFALAILGRRPPPASPSSALAQLSEPNPPAATLECPACQTPVPAPGPRDPASPAWKIRALKAEQRADSAVALLRSHHTPGLFRWIKSKFVQNLVDRHDTLVSHQQKAEEELQSLIERLSSVHAPVAERLRAYEARIQSLEKDLQDKDEENRALIQAKLEATRQQILREEKNRQKDLSLA